MIEVGRVCRKERGHEKGKYCVILEVIDKNFVLVDGQVKRRKCNIAHLTPLPIKVEVKKEMSKDEILKKLAEAGVLKQ